MFSPAVNQAAPSGSVRSSRRRQRQSNDSISGQQPKAKRQRSALSDQTFLPPEDTPEMEEAKPQKVAGLANSRPLASMPRREIAVRSKKTRTGDRSEKEDGISILTKNDTYTVSKLHALPDRLRADIAGRQHGAIYSDSGYALSLTHSHAMVWQYTTNKFAPDTYTFALPYPTKHVSDPLPLGALVSASTSSDEPGLVVIMPESGKITYWESITSAATLDLIKQQRNGVELTIPGLYKGEVVTQVLNAESAGFLLAFTSGRTAYMSVRDAQGRPAITVQFMRSNSGLTGGGIFGSIRNYVKSGASEHIAAARAGESDKIGERNVVVATSNGKLSYWKIHRGGHNTLHAETEGRETIVMAMKEKQPDLSDLLLESFDLLDFTYTPKPPSDAASKDQGEHLLLLASLGRQEAHYALVSVVLKSNTLRVTDVRPIKSYTTPVNRAATSKTRLHLPNPALVAYIVFDQAVVVFSMAKQPDSPESQLRAEGHILPESFEDVVDFRGDMNVEIVGSGIEEPHGNQHGSKDSRSRRARVKHPATVLLVRGSGGGVIRIAATDTSKLTSSIPHKVTARTKLEQAVLYGNSAGNPLNFKVRPELQFPLEEVGIAAVELSLDILKAKVASGKISNAPSSIAANLKGRAAALHHLAEYIKASGVVLDRVTRWKLLWDAEKMEAASNIWKAYDASVAAKPEGQKRGLLDDLVESIHEDFKTNPNPEQGEGDRVRHWFIHDIWNLEIAIPWAFQVIKYTYQDGLTEHSYVMNILSEADDLVIGALESAFSFRTKNLELYNLQTERLENGILEANYEGLPEIWTSTIFIAQNVRKQATLAGALLQEYWPKSTEERPEINPALMDKIRNESPRLVDLAIRANTERIRWVSVQESPALQMEAETLRADQNKAQHEQLSLLAAVFDRADDALAIAEKHRIMSTLAEVMKQEIAFSTANLRNPGLDAAQHQYWKARSSDLDDLVRLYFDKFGPEWADAFYKLQIEQESIADLLNTYQDKDLSHFLTAFLRSKPEYSKISWIHEVSRSHHYEQAAETLLNLGLKHEQHLWSKKVELSLGKLARMADLQANGHSPKVEQKVDLATTRSQLGLIKIQQQAYTYVLPSIAAAIDDNAEVQLAFEAHGNKDLKKQKALSSLLEEGLRHLVKQESMGVMTLIDLLTLMDSVERSGEAGSFKGEQFHLALKALQLGISDKQEQILTLRIIWRRCILKDDWNVVNDTESKDDEQVQDQLRQTALYMTLRAGFKNRLFEKDSPVKQLSPQDILGAGTRELDHRFDRLDVSIRETIMKDMQAEDSALSLFIEQSQLDNWYKAAMDLAKSDFEGEVHLETNEGDSMRYAASLLQEKEQSIKGQAKLDAEKVFNSKKSKVQEKLEGKFLKSSRRENNQADHY
ncbi:Non-repetitive/WGA-negative nucleoporin C-terminal-domain-containing protein [Bisporella sp. PMI_857]|nr:Non-repetitive/WGA-negative nucleoporin C-terminal-domain-containing protein [Bisporella sp. PMI_857]